MRVSSTFSNTYMDTSSLFSSVLRIKIPGYTTLGHIQKTQSKFRVPLYLGGILLSFIIYRTLTMRDLDNHFGEYVHLKQLPREAEALTTLRKAASCVKPIMRKRGWRVGTLSEFLPEDSSLWGLNIDHGRQINLRLRHPGDSNQFLQFEHVLDTLLHELVCPTE